jgi:hypothetical protein
VVATGGDGFGWWDRKPLWVDWSRCEMVAGGGEETDTRAS